ncbi:hypothetical protein BCR35DRAFT_104666 [Leucosporidium creatinivorum]|uniref:Uncharacterized protein n=1 Tax=Leucosporidium creatinivorum TaxID=106004 RepID=A0A1Y2G1E1_9BASI|nr:hypothetical protein BCR35DRAFT_104666 [Leucosporidium creatinivorum]
MLEMLDLTGDSSDDELSPSVASSPRSKVSPSTTKSFSTAPRPSSSRKLSEGPSVEAQAPSKKRKTSSENGSIAKSGSGASAASGAKSTTSSTASPVVVPKSTLPIFAFAQRSTSTFSLSSNSSPRPTQRAFYHTGSPDSPSLPFSTLTLAYTRPDNGKVVRGDDLKLSAFDVFGYGGGTNERGIVATMRLKLDFIGDLVGAGDVQSSSTGNQAGIGIGKPLLLIYDKMDLPSGVGEGAFAVGPIVLHRAPCKFGPVGTHAKLAIVSGALPALLRQASDALSFHSSLAKLPTAPPTFASPSRPPTSTDH